MSRTLELWNRYRACFVHHPSIGLGVDVSRMSFGDGFFAEMEPRMAAAYDAMDALEKGALANPDEGRMVGHYWLRDARRAPTPELAREIESTLARMKAFAADVHGGKIKPEKAERFRNLLVVGIGGSALGPQFVSAALTTPGDKMKIFFFDNTDPDGMDRTLWQLQASGAGLAETMVIVISKSGGTKETRNGQLEAKAAFHKAGLRFGRHFVAVTGDDSELDRTAKAEQWLERFPMWDWVGGRTSELSAVGLLPAALQGLDVEAMLTGARDTDAVTRGRDTRKNPAALLALMWFHAGGGRGAKDMVVLPYKDRLELFSRYLQQLVMESLGKERDLKGNVVHQGIAVYGNKGSTDQHAYVQQLRDGVNNFFVTFIEVLKDRAGERLEVEPNVTSGDCLSGFLQGTRRALHDSNRESITLTIDEVSPRTVGILIALYERAVGFYGALVGINAYHQPGVEAGKKAAAVVLDVQLKLIAELAKGGPRTAEELARAIGAPDEVETAYKVLDHLAANGRARKSGATPADARYGG